MNVQTGKPQKLTGGLHSHRTRCTAGVKVAPYEMPGGKLTNVAMHWGGSQLGLPGWRLRNRQSAKCTVIAAFAEVTMKGEPGRRDMTVLPARQKRQIWYGKTGWSMAVLQQYEENLGVMQLGE